MHKEDIREYAITKSIIKGSNNLNLEFDVFKGESANFFSKYVETLYVFDSFNGLNEDWVGEVNRPASHFSLGKKYQT